MKLIKKILRKYPFYFGVLFITFMVQEFYPFSHYPMYSKFPNWSYTFYFEDETGTNLKEMLPISHSSFSHLYFTECQKKNILYGYGLETLAELQLIGEKITKQAFDFELLKNKTISEVTLFRIYNYTKNDKIVSDTMKIVTIYVE